MLRRILTLLVAVFLLSPQPTAWAQAPGPGGRQIRLEDAPAGPYRIRALTSPIPPRLGELFVEIRVSDSTGAVVHDAEVLLTASPLEGGTSAITTRARGEIAPTPGEYAALMNVTQAGFWRVVVQVNGQEGSGQAEFVERVVPANHWIHVLVVAAPFGGLLALLWVFRRTRTGSTPPTPQPAAHLN
ncbi:MAG: hypothetical protein WD906_04485 [Anaerolineales bacterium]